MRGRSLSGRIFSGCNSIDVLKEAVVASRPIWIFDAVEYSPTFDVPIRMDGMETSKPDVTSPDPISNPDFPLCKTYARVACLHQDFGHGDLETSRDFRLLVHIADFEQFRIVNLELSKHGRSRYRQYGHNGKQSVLFHNFFFFVRPFLFLYPYLLIIFSNNPNY